MKQRARTAGKKIICQNGILFERPYSSLVSVPLPPPPHLPPPLLCVQFSLVDTSVITLDREGKDGLGDVSGHLSSGYRGGRFTVASVWHALSPNGTRSFRYYEKTMKFNLASYHGDNRQ